MSPTSSEGIAIKENVILGDSDDDEEEEVQEKEPRFGKSEEEEVDDCMKEYEELMKERARLQEEMNHLDKLATLTKQNSILKELSSTNFVGVEDTHSTSRRIEVKLTNQEL